MPQPRCPQCDRSVVSGVCQNPDCGWRDEGTPEDRRAAAAQARETLRKAIEKRKREGHHLLPKDTIGGSGR